MRALITIPCIDTQIAATIEPAAGPVGVVIVGGGTQIRIGAHRGEKIRMSNDGTVIVPAAIGDRQEQ